MLMPLMKLLKIAFLADCGAVLVNDACHKFQIPKYRDLHDIYHCQSFSSSLGPEKYNDLGKM